MHIITLDLFESLRIGEAVTVTISDINRAQVKLGIEAPREIPVLREELLQPPPPSAQS